MASNMPATEPLRIVLIGKTGTGKSAVGNTILGEKRFPSRVAAGSVTTDCECYECNHNGRSIKVVDTPGVLDTKIGAEELTAKLVDCIEMSGPGPHAFVLVVRAATFTPEEQKAVEALEIIFGKEVSKHMIVLFTRVDELEGQTLYDFVFSKPSELQKLIVRCGKRYHGFNNRELDNREQVDKLIQMIDRMVIGNGGHFNNEMFREAEEARKHNRTGYTYTFINILKDMVSRYLASLHR